MRTKKAQVSQEYLIVLGIILIIVIPFFTFSLKKAETTTNVAEQVEQVSNVANLVETISNLGAGNTVVIELDNTIQFGENTVDLVNANQETIASAFTIANVPQGTQLQPGTVLVTNNAGTITITNAPTITLVDPTTVKEGEFVDIYGTDFQPNGMTFTLQDESLPTITYQPTFRWIDENHIDFQVLSIEEATYNVYVSMNGYESNKKTLTITKDEEEDE